MIDARPTTAASGMPAPIDLASVIRSGSMPTCSIANIFPVRPKPLCTSSMMRTMPCASASARSSCRNAGGGTTKPPSPSTGSTMIAARSVGETTVFSACSIGPSTPWPRYVYGNGSR